MAPYDWNCNSEADEKVPGADAGNRAGTACDRDLKSSVDAAYGYGEPLPIATNETAAARQANRSLEIVTLDAGQTLPARRPPDGYVYRFAPGTQSTSAAPLSLR
jgi:hypothetical protein